MYRLGFILALFTLFSCIDDGKPNKAARYSKQQFQDSLVAVNKVLMENEDRLINKFIERKKWPVISSGTGLRYMIYENGKGQNLAKAGQFATISYSISLLNGKLCYESGLGNNKSFLIEADDVESGLHEGVKYMKVGDKAKMIIPSHLAHGLLGDLEKIPPRSTIIYDVTLISLR